jgi:hypothetical protein
MRKHYKVCELICRGLAENIKSITSEFKIIRRMPSSGMLCHVALVRIDVGTLRLLVTANVVPSSQILITLMKEAIRSSKTLVLTRATWCNIPENGILHSRRRENLKSFSNSSLFELTSCGQRYYSYKRLRV